MLKSRLFTGFTAVILLLSLRAQAESEIINSDANHSGAKIKVILITPVASEGLSFYNTREIHLAEPWYHFNRADQIIGRGIRNCRHSRLTIENRNVSVFMHASVNDDKNRESIDINAFRISTLSIHGGN